MAFRIAFFGLPLAALLLARDGHELVYVGLSRTNALGLRPARRVFGDRLEVRPDVQSTELRNRIAAAKPDLVVSWFWTTKLPLSLIRLGAQGGLGVHPRRWHCGMCISAWP